jgi:uncharacterized protein
MGNYFLDTSALVKRHVMESGSSWIRSLCRNTTNNAIVISEAAITEVIASVCRMARENPPRLNNTDRDRIISAFQRLVRRNYIVVQVNRAIYERASTLCRSYPLRAYDAIQLACALTKRDDDRKANHPELTFVCADTILLSIAESEGFAVENPNAHR